MKLSKKILLPALVLSGSLSMAINSTLALFVDKNDSNVNIVAGTVSLESSIKITSVYSPKVIATDGTIVDDTNIATAATASTPATFGIGGTATINSNGDLVLSGIAQGDKVTINLTVKNNSNVNIKYRYLSSVTSDNGLFDSLVITKGTELFNCDDITDWALWNLEDESSKTSEFTIEFPGGADIAINNKSCSIKFAVEAIQGNAEVSNSASTAKLRAANKLLRESAAVNDTPTDAINEVTAKLKYAEVFKDVNGYTLAWDRSVDQFILVPNELETLASNVNLYVFTANLTTWVNYSHYLLGTSLTGTLNITKGLDVGKNTLVDDVVYTNTLGNDQNIIIRTANEGTILTVNDASARGVVYHYGVAGYLDIIQCGMSSYHEGGFIPQGQIVKGRVINEVYNEDETQGDLKGVHNLFLVAADNSSFNQIIVGAAAGADLPDLDRPEITIPTTGVLVVEVQTGVTKTTVATDEYIYLTRVGVVEQVVVNDRGTTEYPVAKAKDVSGETTGVEGKQETTQVASEQVSNLYKKNAAGTSYVNSDGNDITIDELATSGVKEDKVTLTEVNYNELFSGGIGTEANPFLIRNTEELRNISEICYLGACGDERFKYDEVFYKVIKDFAIDNDLPLYTDHGANNRTEIIYTWYPALPNINLDLGGHTISNLYKDLIGYVDNATIHNGTFVLTNTANSRGTIVSTVFGDRSGTLSFENLTITGTLSGDLGAHYGPLVSFGYQINSRQVNFLAWKVNSSLIINNTTGGAYTGGLFGYIQGSKAVLMMEDCLVSGQVQSSYAGGFVGGCTNPYYTYCENNTLTGTVLGSGSASAYGTSAATVDATNANIGVCSAVQYFDLANAAIGDEIIISHTDDDVAYYVVTITTFIHGERDNIGGLNRYMKKVIQVTETGEQSLSTGMYKNKIIQVDEDDTSKENLVLFLVTDERMWLDGDTYYYYGGTTGNQRAVITNPGTVYVNIFAYDDSDVLVGYQVGSYTHAI